MLEIQLPAIHRSRSAVLIAEEETEVDDGSGLPEDHVLRPPARRLRRVRAAPLPEDVAPEKDPVPIEEGDEDLVLTEEDVASIERDVVSIDELLVWERTEEKGPIDTRIGRLASLLGIAAVVIVVLVLMFAAGTDVASVFSSLPGS